jgi:hypothetical protein
VRATECESQRISATLYKRQQTLSNMQYTYFFVALNAILSRSVKKLEKQWNKAGNVKIKGLTVQRLEELQTRHKICVGTVRTACNTLSAAVSVFVFVCERSGKLKA